MRRIYGSHPLTIPGGNYLGGEEQNTGFLHLIFSPLFVLNLERICSILISLCCLCRLPIAASLCVSLKTCSCLLNDTVQATLYRLSFDSFWRLRDKIEDRLAALMSLSDRWQGQMIDESSNQRVSPVDSWSTQTINSSPNGVISLSLRKFQ